MTIWAYWLITSLLWLLVLPFMITHEDALIVFTGAALMLLWARYTYTYIECWLIRIENELTKERK